MNLWLLRHGQAEPQTTSDAIRCLTLRGRQEVLQSAAQLLGRPIEAILCSPYVRARQTAELLGEALQCMSILEPVPWLTPENTVADVLKHLAARAETEILLVSHQPLIGELGGTLEHGHRQQPLPMATASLAGFAGPLALAGGMQLASLFHPG